MSARGPAGHRREGRGQIRADGPCPENPSRKRLPSGRQGPLGTGGRNGFMKPTHREGAAERTEVRASRSPADQIAILDKRLGPGVGAVKERERLSKLLAK